jgi:hypothetical protein
VGEVAGGRNGWWARQDSNLRQRRYERRVLTAELRARAPVEPPAGLDAPRRKLAPSPGRVKPEQPAGPIGKLPAPFSDRSGSVR